ncbi:MAG: sporulation protein YabP [Firmicutes bacterium]|nr:sporulation protein YabP [Bacillota bacterium]
METGDHQLSLKKREELRLTGVLNVESFDDQEIIVDTNAGGLIIRGEDLHIGQLNLEAGNLAVHGFVDTLQYTGESMGKRSRGLFGKLFK